MVQGWELFIGRTVGCASAVALVLLGQAASAASPAAYALQSHRAVYDMKLGNAEERSGIAGLSGLMVYDFTGSPCEGYSVNFRFVTEFQDALGDVQVTDLQSTTFEAVEADSYQFLSKTYIDQKLVEETRGTANADQDAKTVKLVKPAEQEVSLDGDVLFPTEHMLKVLEAAKNGVGFVAADIYDGTETGDKVYGTAAVIGKKAMVEESHSADAGKAGWDFKNIGYWPVNVSYFESGTGGSGEVTPVYQFSYRLYENGISRKLLLDYGDFSIKGELVDLEIYEQTACEELTGE